MGLKGMGRIADYLKTRVDNDGKTIAKVVDLKEFMKHHDVGLTP